MSSLTGLASVANLIALLKYSNVKIYDVIEYVDKERRKRGITFNGNQEPDIYDNIEDYLQAISKYRENKTINMINKYSSNAARAESQELYQSLPMYQLEDEKLPPVFQLNTQSSPYDRISYLGGYGGRHHHEDIYDEEDEDEEINQELQDKICFIMDETGAYYWQAYHALSEADGNVDIAIERLINT